MTEILLGNIRGPQGPQGPQGEQGPKGDKGEQGPKGDKPVKGVDYYTEADKQEIVNIVNDALSNFPIIDEIYIGTNEPADKNRVWIKPI